jgi:hypothetical protein
MANGAQLQCTSQLPKAQWKIQGVSFYSDLKIIHLDHFDKFSPMEVHWGAKWLNIPYGSTILTL